MTIWQQLAPIWSYLTAIAIVGEISMMAIGFIYTRRLNRSADDSPIRERVGASKAVLNKLRNDEKLSADELRYAHEIVDQRYSLLIYAIPGTIFALGCFYVFGSLQELHGQPPSIRTFLGLIPIVGSINLTVRLLISGASLKRCVATYLSKGTRVKV